jgi:hypothetical protein
MEGIDQKHNLGTAEITADNFMHKITSAPILQESTRLQAPFKDYTENTDIAWKYVPDKEIESFLESKLFLDTDAIPFADKTEVLEVDRKWSEDTIKIPIDLVVCAAGFVNWTGRSKDKTKTWVSRYGDQETTSLDVIKHYASLSTPLPEVRMVNMYIQPDGKVFFNNGSGDSHRIAAAMLRGEETIETRHICAYKLGYKYYIFATFKSSGLLLNPTSSKSVYTKF